MKQHVFIVNLRRPWHLIAHEECEIISGKKFTWAQRTTGRRCLLGGSAFYLKAGAARRKMSRLNEDAFNRWASPRRRSAALEELATIKKTGEL